MPRGLTAGEKNAAVRAGIRYGIAATRCFRIPDSKSLLGLPLHIIFVPWSIETFAVPVVTNVHPVDIRVDYRQVNIVMRTYRDAHIECRLGYNPELNVLVVATPPEGRVTDA
jgi:hypothetical protein